MTAAFLREHLRLALDCHRRGLHPGQSERVSRSMHEPQLRAPALDVERLLVVTFWSNDEHSSLIGNFKKREAGHGISYAESALHV